jgi:ABC-2 type transport system permease protein
MVSPLVTFTRYRWIRLRNTFSRGISPSIFLSLFLGVVIFLGTLKQSHDVVNRVDRLMGQSQIVDGVVSWPGWKCGGLLSSTSTTNVQCQAFGELGAGGFSQASERTLAWISLLLWLVVLLMNFSGRELRAVDWDLEWLVTLPISRSSIVWGQWLDRTLLNPTAFVVLVPWASYLGWAMGYGWWTILFALAFCFLAGAMESATRLYLDFALRASWPLSRLKNLQAVFSLATAFLIFTVLSVLFLEKPPLLVGVALILSWPIELFPPFAFLAAKARGSGISFFGDILWSIAAVVGFCWLILARVEQRIRRGISVGITGAKLSRAISSKDIFWKGWGTWFGPLFRREVQLLSRDRNYLAQTIFVPFLVVVAQLYIQVKGGGEWLGNVSVLSALAFGAAAYGLIFSALQMVNSEGRGLWLVYTFPLGPEEFFQKKLRFWIAVALLYPTFFFLLGAQRGMDVKSLWIDAIFVLGGILLFSKLALAFGVLGVRPWEEERARKFSLGYLYLFFLLSGIYAASFFISNLWIRFMALALAGILAMGFWQRARDRFPILLDPHCVRPAQLSLAHGGIALLAILILQTTLAAYMGWKNWGNLGEGALLASTAAYCLIAIGAFLILKTNAVKNAPILFSTKILRDSIGGIVLGVLLAGGFMAFSMGSNSAEVHPISALLKDHQWSIGMLGVLLAVSALAYEYIFRGLIFSGIQRSWGSFWGAFASAALYSLFREPSQAVPNFLMGLVLVIAFKVSGGLLAPMIAHGVFNLVIFYGL